MFDNPLLLTDSYKVSHSVQYPPGTTNVYSYFESRGGEYKETVFFGLQYFLKKYLSQPVEFYHVDQAEKLFEKHLGPGVFQRHLWDYIVQVHKGRLPVEIKAVPEGTVVPTRNVLMTIENTDPECYWLTNYLETLLVQVWYPTTVATISREMKRVIASALERSGSMDGLGYKLHDFGFRGVSSVESAGIGGAAHLVNFMGTDTLSALAVCADVYGEPCAGFSIPAAEHSTITSWGKDKEADAYQNMLTQFPKGLVAVVSDSWDIHHACKHIWGRKLKKLVMDRDGTLVIRPDSGDPRQILPELLDILGREFGCYTNDKNFKVLHDKVRLIQGDGITRHSLVGILDAVLAAGWSADNLAFGSGGGLLQDVNRDTQKFAFKCSEVTLERLAAHGNSPAFVERREVSKSPKTAPWKSSKAGRLALVKHPVFQTVHGSEWATIPESSLISSVAFGEEVAPADPNRLQTVFKNGELTSLQTLAEIRQRASL